MSMKLGVIRMVAAAFIGALPAVITAQTAAERTQAAPQRLSAQQLEKVVAPIALYPDDLLAIVLPASTTPLEIVKAQRFLDKRKKDSKLQPDASVPAPVKSLLNYPEVVKTMHDDLDWTTALGDAVTAQQKDVIDAIQMFRRKVYSVGNLKTDDKQIVVVEKETIKVVQANPQVIYVPQYQPTQVVVVQSVPVYAYYPTAYPVYYYPYPPGAAFATGLIVGATVAHAVNWHHASIDIDVNVNDLQRQRIDYANAAREDRQAHVQSNQAQRQNQISQNQTQRQQSAAESQRPGTATTQRPTQPAVTQPAKTWQPANAGVSSRAPSHLSGASAQPSAFHGFDSGAAASRNSARGAQSRSGAGRRG